MTSERIPPVPIAQEQILDMLQTRGFESGFQSSPLRDFWGTLTSITGEMRTGQRGAFAVSLFNFGEVEVLHSVETYESPVAQIEIPVSSRDKSRMGYWGNSVDDIINPGVDKSLSHNAPGVKKHDYLLGKRLRVALTPGHPLSNKDDVTGQWVDKPTDCWTLVEMQGEGAPATVSVPGATTAPTVDATAIALGLLNGKTVQQWHSEVFGHPSIKGNATLINQIISGEFLSGLEAAGKIAKDNGVYTVV